MYRRGEKKNERRTARLTDDTMFSKTIEVKHEYASRYVNKFRSRISISSSSSTIKRVIFNESDTKSRLSEGRVYSVISRHGRPAFDQAYEVQLDLSR